MVMLGLLLLLVGLAYLESNAPPPVDWSRSYSRYHDKPYGARLIYERLPDLFPSVRTVQEPLYDLLYMLDDTNAAPHNLIFIDNVFHADSFDTDLLLWRVEQGDHLLIAAENIRGELSDTLKLATESDFQARDTVDIRAVGDHKISTRPHRFTRGFFPSYFTRYDTARTRVLAVDGRSRPVVIQMAWGAGHITFCSAPLVLTNFNLIKDRNGEFLAGVLSTLPPLPVLWDEFGKVAHNEASTPMRYVLGQPPLKWAWFLGLFLLALFIVVRARREQRVIPVVKAPRNASRELVDTIGRLYHQRGDHADLARKMIAHFKEEVRVRTYLRTFAFDDATYDHLAAKMGLPREVVAERFGRIAALEHTRHLTQDQLLKLSSELHDLRQLL